MLITNREFGMPSVDYHGRDEIIAMFEAAMISMEEQARQNHPGLMMPESKMQKIRADELAKLEPKIKAHEEAHEQFAATSANLKVAYQRTGDVESAKDSGNIFLESEKVDKALADAERLLTAARNANRKAISAVRQTTGKLGNFGTDHNFR